MRHGSLFSGIGGFDLAAEWMEWENVFYCENEPFCNQILNYYWPNADSLEDIKKVDFKKYANEIDILTGGFPCQPYSGAGKRLGKEDVRHLWPEMLRSIREISPRWVVGENVRGIVSWNGGLVFEEVQADLEAEGYEVWTFILPAAGINAPHRRDRVWFIAYSGSNGCQWNQESTKGLESDKGRKAFSEFDAYASSGNVTDSSSKRLQGGTQSGSFKSKRKINQQQFARQNIIPGWEEFPTQPPICGGDDGLPTELDGITFFKWHEESIRGYGNAVVPQVVL